MISVLIPLYNFDTRNFINEIHRQLIKSVKNFEIIVFDDNSEKQFQELNSEIKLLANLKFIQSEKNKGRSLARNILAQNAEYENILFLDCDLMPANENFIAEYLKHLEKYQIICGGIKYQPEKPENNYILRWKYGKFREEIAAEKRNAQKYSSFLSSNFMIKKEIFLQIKFNEKITEYGHEDTVFGIELKKQNIDILHINNPVIHLGIERNNVFIDKVEKSLKNLKYIDTFLNINNLSSYVKILKFYKNVYSFRFFIKIIFKTIKPILLKNLKSKNPSLFLLDFYKLGYYSTLK